MRKIVVSMNITLDGFMAGPAGELDWHFRSWTAEMAEILCRHLSSTDTILLGSATYKGMAGYWPAVVTDRGFPRADLPFAEMMNNYPKIVFSRALVKASWNNSRIIRGPLRSEITKLKQQKGKDIMVYGSGELVTALMRSGLIDQYILWVHPVILGRGKRLFKQLATQPHMKLLSTVSCSSGVVILYYEAENR
jgi:dihydrofolate reductase